MEDDNISVHLERLAQSDPALAQNIKNAMSKLASERDAANERARQSIIADQRTLQQKAEDEILAERRAVRHYEVPEKGIRIIDGEKRDIIIARFRVSVRGFDEPLTVKRFLLATISPVQP